MYKIVLVVFFPILFCMACGSRDDHRVFSDAWYDVYGNQCGNLRPGCNFFADGKKITLTQDPNWHYGDGGIDNYGINGTINYTDSWGNGQVYTGYYWPSPNGIIYGDHDRYGFQAINDIGSESGRNVVGDAAKLEKEMIGKAAKNLADRYNLPLETGEKVARALSVWPFLANNRARTESDLEKVTFNLYGVDVKKIRAGLKQAQEGNLQLLEENAREAALNWATTPETFKAIQTKWFSWAIDSYGIRNN